MQADGNAGHPGLISGGVLNRRAYVEDRTSFAALNKNSCDVVLLCFPHRIESQNGTRFRSALAMTGCLAA